ncbi:MAG TPA: TraB/GumN family protein [Sphingomicrobium sp.]|nr:TraB/GumN family protein [Sphingomicrobium sp.]
MVNMLVAAALASAIPTAPQTPAPVSEPALFVVRDSDTTIYIFGTFHALDGKSQWLGADVRNALEQSAELVLETLIPEKPSETSLPAERLRPLLITPSASFLATTRMAIDAGRARGMQVDNGADMILRHIAESEGKPVEGLETLQLQINMFNRMPPSPAGGPTKAREAAADAARFEGLAKAMAEMQAAWKRGDQSVFVRMLSQLKAASPETYRMMFTERNARWADWIRARMQAPGTVFIAVGAGHLAGPDSLLVRLAERGFASQRVN